MEKALNLLFIDRHNEHCMYIKKNKYTPVNQYIINAKEQCALIS